MIRRMGDSGDVTLVAEYSEPVSRRRPRGVEHLLRWICFLTLVASTLIALPARFPNQTDLDQLFRDVLSGHASSVSIEDLGGQTPVNDVRVRWKTSMFGWHETNTSPLPCLGPQEKFVVQYTDPELTVSGPIGGSNCKDADAVMRAYLQSAAGPRGITVNSYPSHETPGLHVNTSFMYLVAPTALAVITGFLWIATFLGMLFTRDHPYANRWAWLWLFTVGGVGPMLMLWMEPTPLRLRFRRGSDETYRWRRPPLTGWAGLGLAIGWTIGLTAAGWGLSVLAGHL